MISLERAQTAQENSRYPTEKRDTPRLRMFFWCLAIVLGALQVWAHCNEMNPDGISYIEMAEAAGRGGGWHALINGYWSPLYPSLLSVSFQLLHPTPYWEFTVVHAVNFAVYLADLFCFEILLRELFAARRSEGASGKGLQPVPDKILWTWGYLLFLWSSQFWLSLATPNPDILVAGLVYLATALLLHVYQGKGSWFLFAALGLVLGIAYLAKTAMFLVSFAFLASAFLLFAMRRGSYSNALAKSALALVVFLALASPLVVAISKDKHRATFGDSGRIAYAEYVNRAPLTTHWQGQPAGTGNPAHPTRKVSSDAPIYEFAQPIAGSYPPWYDPSYWYEGVRPHFWLKGQLWVLFRSVNLYLKLFSRSGALYVMFLALVIAVRKAGKWECGEVRMWLVWVPSFAALGMYALVLVEQRYVAPFALILLLWVLTSARISVNAAEELRGRSAPLMIAALALATAWPVVRDVRDVIRNQPYEPWEVAVGLHEMGIAPGTQVGSIGSGLSAYWAHLGEVKIIAEIPEKDWPSFLAVDSAKKTEVLHKFAELGARAVVTKNAAIAQSMDGWQEVGQTHYYVWRAPAISQ